MQAFFRHWTFAVSGFLMSTGWWYLFYSLSPFQNILLVLYEILSFYFLARALMDGRKSDFALAGIFVGFCFMEYLPGRLIPFLVGLVLLGIHLSEGRTFLKNYAGRLALTIFAFFWWVGPYLIFALTHLSEFLSRSRELSVFNAVQQTGNYGLIFEKIGWTLLTFVHQNKAQDQRFCPPCPQLDPLVGALLLLALVLIFTHYRKRLSWYILPGFAFGVAANAFSIQWPSFDPTYVNGLRNFFIVPFIFLAAGWSLDWLFRFFSGFSRGIQRTGFFLLALVVISAVAWNSRIYYFTYSDTKANYGDKYWDPLCFNQIEVADFLKANYPRCHLLVDWEYDSSTVNVLTRDKIKMTDINKDLILPINYKVNRNVMLLFIPNKLDLDKLRQLYPRAVWGELQSPWHLTFVKTMEISKEDIESLQKDMPLGPEIP